MFDFYGHSICIDKEFKHNVLILRNLKRYIIVVLKLQCSKLKIYIANLNLVSFIALGLIHLIIIGVVIVYRV